MTMSERVAAKKKFLNSRQNPSVTMSPGMTYCLAFDQGYALGLCHAQERCQNADPVKNALSLLGQARRELELPCDSDRADIITTGIENIYTRLLACHNNANNSVQE